MSNPKPDLHNINAHIKFGEIHWDLLKLLSLNLKTNVSRADISVENWRILLISNPKPDLHNINAITKFLDKSLDIFWSYHPEMKIRIVAKIRTVENRQHFTH